MKRRLLATLISSLMLGVGAVHAQDMNTEVENNSTGAASAQQQLNIASGTAVVDGQINYAGDVDYYYFAAKAGDVVTIDIDGGVTGDMFTDVDTSLGLFLSGWDSNGIAFPLLTSNISAGANPPDSGSVLDAFGADSDPYIGAYTIPADGNYIVGVAPGYDAMFLYGGDAIYVDPYVPTGPYKLIISGVSPATTTAAVDTTTATADPTAT
ncbi:MAG: PPC domain-containing protein, partial [Hylemonella sp.]|nr:PPC domain-containing protein [Hylemonella sp.]